MSVSLDVRSNQNDSRAWANPSRSLSSSSAPQASLPLPAVALQAPGKHYCSAGRFKASFILLMAFTSSWVLSCGRVPDTSYYTIAPHSSHSQVAKQSYSDHRRIDLILGVERFTAEAVLDDDRIIYRESPYEINYYNYRRWAAPPRMLVTDKIVGQLLANGAFRNVKAYPSAGRVDYVLGGRILAFEEWDRDDKWVGKVAFTAQLREVRSGRLVWTGEFEQETPARKKLPIAVVEAISTSLEKCVAELETAIAQALSSDAE